MNDNAEFRIEFIDPDQLADTPLLGDAMTEAGFVLSGEPGIWEQRFERAGFDGEVTVPVDLIDRARWVA